jgi:hypothetical protein
MSTPCIIAVKTENGILASYCHFDGYHDYMWPMLNENYNSEELARNLVSMGDASYITAKQWPDSNEHSFHNPEPGVSVFYHRDRGEPWDFVKPELYESEFKLLGLQPYIYVFQNGHWEELLA